MESKRKQLSKKKRFEVLKRDKFTCQYCGAQAPDVILQVDHIIPVSKGGTNDITNLVTSCSDCNGGKSNEMLDDSTAVKKQKRQLDQLQEQREQLEMMAEWQRELTSEMLSKADIVENIVHQITGSNLTSSEKKKVNSLISKFGFEVVCDATRTAFVRYAHDTNDEFDFAFSKIGGICYCSTHRTCYECKHFTSKWNKMICMFDGGRIRSVKEAERCEGFEQKQ